MHCSVVSGILDVLSCVQIENKANIRASATETFSKSGGNRQQAGLENIHWWSVHPESWPMSNPETVV